MKNKVLLILALLLPVSVYSQDWRGFFGAKRDSILAKQVTDNPLIHKEFVYAKELKDGYTCFTYKIRIESFSKSSLEMFYFDKNDLCVAIKMINDLDEFGNEIKDLYSFGYKKIGPNTFYYQKTNVKATYNKDVKKRLSVIIYSLKETPNIFK